MTDVVAIYRAERFSPNAVERDRAIMDEVCALLEAHATPVVRIREEDLSLLPPGTRVCLSMARDAHSLDILTEAQRRGVRVINSAERLSFCTRRAIDTAMRGNKLPCAPLYGKDGYWLKRADESAQSKDDVVFVPGEDAVEPALQAFRQRGIADVVVTAHVAGDLVKFYGVAGEAPFFSHHYPTDGTWSKFGDELSNGRAAHYGFSQESLSRDAARLAAIMGLEVYGGDCIVRADGSYAIIDFNDWPSFAPCRHEAAQAIARLAMEAMRSAR